MALNQKNTEIERLADEVARLTGESKSEAIRRALEERKHRLTHLAADDRRTRLLKFLEKKVWSTIPADQRGTSLSRTEEDEILGFGPGGA